MTPDTELRDTSPAGQRRRDKYSIMVRVHRMSMVFAVLALSIAGVNSALLWDARDRLEQRQEENRESNLLQFDTRYSNVLRTCLSDAESNRTAKQHARAIFGGRGPNAVRPINLLVDDLQPDLTRGGKDPRGCHRHAANAVSRNVPPAPPEVRKKFEALDR